MQRKNFQLEFLLLIIRNVWSRFPCPALEVAWVKPLENCRRKLLLPKQFGTNGFIQRRNRTRFRTNIVYGIFCFKLQMQVSSATSENIEVSFAFQIHAGYIIFFRQLKCHLLAQNEV